MPKVKPPVRTYVSKIPQGLAETPSKLAKIYEEYHTPEKIVPETETSFFLMSPNKDSAEITPRKQKLKQKLVTKSKKLIATQKSVKRLKDKLSALKQNSPKQISTLTGANANVSHFIHMLAFHKKRKPWNAAERKIAIGLFYRSPSCYNYMRQSLKFSLPSESVIRNWLNVISLRTGSTSKLMNKISNKVNTMDEREKQCVLLFDEMSIRRHFDYSDNIGYIEGFQDLGEIGGRSSKAGTQALVFMVRGLYDNWKMPLAYFISHGPVPFRMLHNVLIKVLDQLCSLKLHVRGIICDQAANNRAAISNLNITTEAPFFYHNGTKIFVMYDTPHLIKSVRNTLLKQNMYTSNGEVSWKDVADTYNIDKYSRLSTALTKITPAHIQPNAFQKMTVRYATQVFSRRYVAAMQTAIQTGELKSATASNTAEFMLKLNNLFDCLNSRSFYDANTYKCALSEKAPLVEKTLRDAISWIESWSVPKNQPFCFDGLKQTINAVLGLWIDTKSEYPYLLTQRLNQDPLENLFAKIRHRRGFDPNPSAKHFRLALQAIITSFLQKSVETANCENDDDIYMLERDCEIINADFSQDTSPNITSVSAVSEVDTVKRTSTSSDFLTTSVTATVINPGEETVHTLENQAVNYLAGYVAHRTLTQFHCDNCKKTLIKKEESIDEMEFLIMKRDYECEDNIKYLKRPSEETYQIVHCCLEIYEDFIRKEPHSVDIKNKILNKIVECQHILLWLLEECACNEHRKYFLERLIKVKLYNTCKKLSMEKKQSDKSSKRKISILKNA